MLERNGRAMEPGEGQMGNVGLDDVTGSIEEGKWADKIILNHNLFEIPETDIHKTEVQRTLFKGDVVYEI